MGELRVGDQVICLIQSKSIVNAYDATYERKQIFEIIALYADGLLLYVPTDVILIDCFDITKLNYQKFGINKRFIGSQCYYITDHKVVGIHERADGMSCIRCGEFFPMAEANLPDGTMKCWQCRVYKYR
jgi:hypothetical protein